MLTTKVASGTAGFRPGFLSESNSRILTRTQTQAFQTQIDTLDFWHLANPVNDQTGSDGSQWVIEGIKGGQYHVVDRWSPKNGPVRELGLMLAFDLAHISIPKKDIY